MTALEIVAELFRKTAEAVITGDLQQVYCDTQRTLFLERLNVDTIIGAKCRLRAFA